MAGMKPHRRQWIISTQRRHETLDGILGFQVRQIGNGLFLHHDSTLLVEQREGRLILGRMLRDGDGRYVIIENGRLHLDATGSMGVLYFKSGTVRCGSSPVLLSLITGNRFKDLDRTHKLSWIPSPGAPMAGARRLMVDEVLDLETAEVLVEPRTLSKYTTVESAAFKLVADADATVRALANTKKPIYLALTAGRDSRTAFAALVKSGVSFKAYTFLLSDGASRMDVRCARELCRLYGVEHTAVTPRWWGASKRKRIYLEHSGGMDSDRGYEYASGDYYRHIPDDAIVIHGATLGLNKRLFAKVFDHLSDMSSDGIIGAIQDYFGKLDSGYIQLLEEWCSHRDRHPIGGVVDDFLLDQRRGAWGASNRFAEDIFGFEWFIFSNS